jgi:acyl-CoA thioester hydrolase
MVSHGTPPSVLTRLADNAAPKGEAGEKAMSQSESHEIAIRVRYAETDRMGLLHHANYFVYFEMGRTELLRQRGRTYRDVEDAGHYLVIIDIGCKFKRPAHYDDLLILKTTVAKVTHVKIVHHYELFRDGILLAEGHSTLACVDAEGKPQALPGTLK